MVDCIIIGAGWSGVKQAIHLAKLGRSVVLLEQRPFVGGLSAVTSITGGCYAPVGIHEMGGLAEVVGDAHVQRGEALLFAPQLDGASVTLWQDAQRTADELGMPHYATFVADVVRMADQLRALLQQAPPQTRFTELLRWGQAVPDSEFWRTLATPVQTVLDRVFDHATLKAGLAVDGLLFSRQGPLSAGTMLSFLWRWLYARGWVAGEMGDLRGATAVLHNTLQQYPNIELRLNTMVKQILREANTAIGVELTTGEQLLAPQIISTATPAHTMLELVGAHNLPLETVRQHQATIYDGTTARINWVVSELPTFVGQTAVSQLTGQIRFVSHMDDLQRASDSWKYGELSATPLVDMTIPSLVDESLTTNGRHVLSLLVQYVPAQTTASELSEVVRAFVGQYVPNLLEIIQHEQVILPTDWQRQFNLTEGHLWHGEMGLEQFSGLRHAIDTPLKNLYLCSIGSRVGLVTPNLNTF